MVWNLMILHGRPEDLWVIASKYLRPTYNGHYWIRKIPYICVNIISLKKQWWKGTATTYKMFTLSTLCTKISWKLISEKDRLQLCISICFWGKFCISLTHLWLTFPFYTPWNTRKPKVFWCFQGEWNGSIGQK